MRNRFPTTKILKQMSFRLDLPTKIERKKDERVGDGAENTSSTQPTNSGVTEEMVAAVELFEPNEQTKTFNHSYNLRSIHTKQPPTARKGGGGDVTARTQWRWRPWVDLPRVCGGFVFTIMK
jgi:hypothetical protein